MQRLGHLGWLVTIAGLAGGFGCTSHPLPLSAQVGATVAIPISNQPETESIGFGAEWYESSGLFDDQRGRLTFTFTDGANTSAPVDPLLVSRMYPDPATDAARNGFVDLGFGTVALLGQIVALVNVPDVPPGPYDIVIGRKIRTAPGVWTDVTPVPAYNGQIEVLPADVGGYQGTPNDPPVGAIGAGLGTGFELDIEYTMVDVYPHPAAMIGLPVNPRPSAGRIVVQFDPAKVAILGTTAERPASFDSTVVSAVTGSDTVVVDFVSPDTRYERFGLLFTPVDPFGAGRPAVGDFTIDAAASRLYDADGVPVHDDGSGGVIVDKIQVVEIR